MISNGLIEGPKPTATPETGASLKTGANAVGDVFAKIMLEASQAVETSAIALAQPTPATIPGAGILAEATKGDVTTLEGDELEQVLTEGIIPTVALPMQPIAAPVQPAQPVVSPDLSIDAPVLTETAPITAVDGVTLDVQTDTQTAEVIDPSLAIGDDATDASAVATEGGTAEESETIVAQTGTPAPQVKTETAQTLAAAVQADQPRAAANTNSPVESNQLDPSRATVAGDPRASTVAGDQNPKGNSDPNANPNGNADVEMPDITAKTEPSSSSQAYTVSADDSGATTQSAPSVSGPLPGPPIAVAAPAAEPAHGSVAPSSFAPAAQSPLPMTSDTWPETLVQTISQSVDGEIENLSITMTPERLGTLQIKLEIVDGVANVKIVTETPEAAKMFTDAQAKLGDLMTRAGLEMGSHSATSSGNQNAAGNGQGGNGTTQYGQGTDENGAPMTELEPETVLTGLSRRSNLSATVDLLA